MDEKKASLTREFLEAKTKGDVSSVVACSQVAEGGRKKIRLRDHDCDPTLPCGCVVSFESVKANDIKPGTFLIMRAGKGTKVRRFIRYHHEPGSIKVVCATIGGELEEPSSLKSVVGQIVEAEYQGRKWNPSKPGFIDRLTEYHTNSFMTSILGAFIK